MRIANALREIPAPGVMIEVKPCGKLSANGWSVHARCVNVPKEIHEVVVMIVAAMIEAKICVRFGKSA